MVPREGSRHDPLSIRSICFVKTAGVLSSSSAPSSGADLSPSQPRPTLCFATASSCVCWTMDLIRQNFNVLDISTVERLRDATCRRVRLHHIR
jgi:hypothetical protein